MLGDGRHIEEILGDSAFAALCTGLLSILQQTVGLDDEFLQLELSSGDLVLEADHSFEDAQLDVSDRLVQ